MDTSAISSLTTLYPTQKTSGISAPVISNSNGDKDGSRVSGTGGGHHHHGGGAFMQNVMQSLQSLGLNFPAPNANSTSPVDGTSSNSDTVQSTLSSSNIGQALHTFLHDLHQALNQGGLQQQSSATDSDGDNDNSSSSSSGVQNGYSNFSTKLQSLISSLSNNSDNNSTLQTDFTNLVNALGGSSSTSSASPNLQDFLNKMVSNAGNNSSPQNGLGSILTTKA
jgi:hypothetical protein